MTIRMSDKMNKGFIIILFILVFSIQGFALLIVNGSEGGFQGPESTVIEEQVILGAGFFLESQADMMRFANRIELAKIQGTNYTELQQLIESAITNMTNATNRYHELTQTADSALYDEVTLNNLAVFDYSGFRHMRSMNSEILSDVESYLVNGDIRGMYHHLHADTQNILTILGKLKASVDSGTFPDVADIWQAHSAFSKTLLFGQYAAEIFIDINGK